eukprot:GSA25T00018167001.1
MESADSAGNERLLERQNQQLLEELRLLKACLAVPVSSEQALERLLREDAAHGQSSLDAFGTEQWGTFPDFFEEIRSGFSALRRVIEVVRLRLSFPKDSGYTLVESHKQSPDGRLFFSKQLLPSKQKHLTLETSEDAAERFLSETFFNDLNLEEWQACVVTKPDYTYTEGEPDWRADQFPVRCHVRRHDLSFAIVTGSAAAGVHADILERVMRKVGLPQAQPFTTTEHGTTSFWSWYRAAALSSILSDAKGGAVVGGPSSNRAGGLQAARLRELDLTKTMDSIFGQHRNRTAYQTLLLQMFGQQFEASKLCGGFSGSLVLRVQPFDADGTPEEPVIVKLDRAAPIREEVLNSLNVYDVLQDRAAKVLGDPVFCCKAKN